MGVVYVLTNEAFKEGYVKIGRTTNLEQRLRQLDNTSVPTPFRCVFAIEVPNDAEVEKLVHQAFADNRKRSTREFFVIDFSRVIAALKLTGGVEVTPKSDVAEDSEGIEVLQREIKRRAAPATFSDAGLKPGDVVSYLRDERITATVLSDRKILFEGSATSVSAAALILLQREGYTWQTVNGWHYWLFEGVSLAEKLQAAVDEKVTEDLYDEGN